MTPTKTLPASNEPSVDEAIDYLCSMAQADLSLKGDRPGRTANVRVRRYARVVLELQGAIERSGIFGSPDGKPADRIVLTNAELEALRGAVVDTENDLETEEEDRGRSTKRKRDTLGRAWGKIVAARALR